MRIVKSGLTVNRVDQSGRSDGYSRYKNIYTVTLETIQPKSRMSFDFESLSFERIDAIKYWMEKAASENLEFSAISISQDGDIVFEGIDLTVPEPLKQSNGTTMNEAKLSPIDDIKEYIQAAQDIEAMPSSDAATLLGVLLMKRVGRLIKLEFPTEIEADSLNITGKD
jgi:hypothetical protein